MSSSVPFATTVKGDYPMPIRIENLQKSFGSLPVLRDFSHDFLEGKIYCLFGPSGCGKTTLLHLIAGILPWDGGLVSGAENKKIAFVFQEDRLLPWRTAEENIRFVLRQENRDVLQYLRAVNLEEFKDYLPHQLSGGMARRVALARAFAYQGQILLMDEPFKGIDEETKKKIMDYILHQKATDNPEQIIIFTTHSIEESKYMAHETVRFP